MDVDVIREQVRLAQNYGIYGFCFHYYWFNGRRMLDKPLDIFLNALDIDFPFCVNWANENWTRRWNEHNHEVLLEQKYSEEDDLACIKEIGKYVRDKRYIRVKDRPLILIYKSTLFPNINNTIRIWREYCKEAGIGDICLVGINAGAGKSLGETH